MGRLARLLVRSRVYRSIVRHGFPDSNRNRSLAVFSNFFLHIHPVKARLRAIRFSRTFYLGGLSAACLFILIVTGVLLMFYYRPAVPRAYHDMKDLEFVVSQGVFLRNLHRWSAHAMVAFVFLHMTVTFLRGAYRPPREFNWVLGVVLFLVTILLSYTGYLLPWDQLAYWAVTVGTNMADATPLIGHEIKLLLLGGTTINEEALLRFHVLHCAILPLVMFVLIGVHIWRVRKDGGIHLPAPEPRPVEPSPAVPAGGAKVGAARLLLVQDESRPAVDASDEPMVMTFPHLLVRELIAFLALSLLLVIAALVFNAPLEEIANPDKTPNPAKAPWYFLGLQELLHYYPPVVSGVLLPSLLVVALAVIPYFRVNLERPPFWETRRTAKLVGLWSVVAVFTTLFATTGAHPVWPIIGPLWVVATTMSAGSLLTGTGRGSRWLHSRSIPFWIFVWFLLSAATLTAVGIFFRGPGWRFTLPWRDGVFY